MAANVLSGSPRRRLAEHRAFTGKGGITTGDEIVVDFRHVKPDGLVVGEDFCFQRPDRSRVIVEHESQIRLRGSRSPAFPFRLLRRLMYNAKRLVAAQTLRNPKVQEEIQRPLLVLVALGNGKYVHVLREE